MLIKIIFIIFIFYNYSFASDIPIIVIAPSKQPQSISTVGSSVTVYTEEDLNESSEIFLQDVINYNSPGLSAYQSGGVGTQSGVQLRGLPKRYTTIYVDGIKQSDPSTVSNDYYFDDLMKSSVSRIEILRGNQSSIYGSGAMGGTVNITTKKGKKGFHKNMDLTTGSEHTLNFSGSISGADDKSDFWLGYEKFKNDGESAMTDNNEKDSYSNDTFVGNFGYELNDKLRLEGNSRFIYSFLNYDSLDSKFSTNTDDNSQNWNKEWNTSFGLTHQPLEKFNQSIKLVHSYNDRTYDAFSEWGSGKSEAEYLGFRDALYYNANYKFNLDNNLSIGAEYEDDEMKYKKSLYRGNEIKSLYYDLQSRLSENFYTTIGMRFDDHSEAGNEDSHRISFAYLSDDKKTKYKGTYGTSFRFPSLYENYQAWTSSEFKGKMTAETGRSFDIGLEKKLFNDKLGFDLTYFNHKYEDTLDGWKDAASDVNSYYHNQPGLIKSEGFELAASYNHSSNLNFNLNYTLSRTYDGADMDDALDKDGNSGGTGGGAFTDSRMVRVPRHMIGLNTYYNFPNTNISLKLQTIAASNARDYGNFNSPKHGDDYADVKLDAYIVNHLTFDFNNLEGYKTYLKFINIFDEEYNTALDYSQPSRSFRLGIKRVY